jgi:hypothetical protein
MKNPSAKYSGLRRAANMLRKHGQGGDTVLAHISPEEAAYLHQRYGGDINPHTGLPQYGLFGRVFGGVGKSIGRAFKKPLKTVLPLAGSIIGGAIGGPAGSIAGGALGGGLSSRRHPLDRALGGALMGLGNSFISPQIAQGLNLNPDSFASRMLMHNAPSLGEQMGIGSGMGSGMGFFGSGGAGLDAAASSAGAGAASGLSGGAASLGLGSGSLMDTALLATAIAGMAKKQKMPVYGSPDNESLQQAMDKNKPHWGPEYQYKEPAPLKREAKFPPKGYRRTEWKFFPTPEEQEEQLRRANEEIAQPGYQYRYAKGGHVRYYEGAEGGQSDKRPVTLPEHSYIMDATTVSLAGDGNSKNGKKRIAKEIVKNFLESGITKEYKPSRNIKAYVSDGEMEISPQVVYAAGGGDIHKGIKKLDKFRKNIRKHKGVKKFLPPKSKHLMQYVR